MLFLTLLLRRHYGHYTMYLKSIVYRQDKCVALCAAPYAPILTNLLFSCSVFLAQNIYCQNYVSGNDTVFMGWHNLVRPSTWYFLVETYAH